MLLNLCFLRQQLLIRFAENTYNNLFCKYFDPKFTCLVGIQSEYGVDSSDPRAIVCKIKWTLRMFFVHNIQRAHSWEIGWTPKCRGSYGQQLFWRAFFAKKSSVDFWGFDQNKELISKKCLIIFGAQYRPKVQIYFEFFQNRFCGLDWRWFRI